MKRLDLIKTLQKKADISMREAELVVERFFGGISDALADGERVEIRGFCTFSVKNYKAYTGRNPKTNEKIEIKAKRMPVFKPSKMFLNREQPQ